MLGICVVLFGITHIKGPMGMHGISCSCDRSFVVLGIRSPDAMLKVGRIEVFRDQVMIAIDMRSAAAVWQVHMSANKTYHKWVSITVCRLSNILLTA